ncbi:FAD/NAD(P)-binding protein [Galbibacter sp.]|jgi:uncharacterized NAD(P)/FAD-binding protein YdhS|uniref:FAD/NAD(P)-binding protein n=1 Tax=Galbibacter sp. TaxID=2918471 RepID=UPI003A950304
MYNVNPNNHTDLCFIGSGISSAFTLIHLLENRIADDVQTPLHVAIVEKYHEFHTGIPYGNRSGNSVLLITSLKNFLPQPEYSIFINWLNENHSTLLAQMRTSGGTLTAQWLEKHKESIARQQWGDLFIPRSFFGVYLKDRLNSLIEKQSLNGKLKVQYIHTEVTKIKKTGEGYTISGDGLNIQSKKIILAVGSLPTRSIYTNKNIQQSEQLLVINQIYRPSLDENLDRISNFTAKQLHSGKHCNILVIGANASALELLYKLNDGHKKAESNTSFSFLSTHGLLPDCEIDHIKQSDFITSHLNELQSQETLTAFQISEAVKKDLDAAQDIHLGAASTVGIISKVFGALLSKLDSKELKKFACVYGNEIGRRQRCAGQHYLDVIADLKSKGRFTHIQGRFKDLIEQKRGLYHLQFEDPKTKTVKISEKPFHVVINCIGSTRFDSDQKQLPPLLKNLIDQGLAHPNRSQIGLEVNTKLECSENLHIIGPLLAGNIIDSKAVWHVEHCGRIIWLSEILAKTIHHHANTPASVG